MSATWYSPWPLRLRLPTGSVSSGGALREGPCRPSPRAWRVVLLRVSAGRASCHRSFVPARSAFPLPGPFGLNGEPWTPTGTGSVRSPPDRGIPLRSVRPEHGCSIERASFGGCTPGVRSLLHFHTLITEVDTHLSQGLPIRGSVPCILPHPPPGEALRRPLRGPEERRSSLSVLRVVLSCWAVLYRISPGCASGAVARLSHPASEPFTTGRSTFLGASVTPVTHSLCCLAELDSTRVGPGVQVGLASRSLPRGGDRQNIATLAQLGQVRRSGPVRAALSARLAACWHGPGPPVRPPARSPGEDRAGVATGAAREGSTGRRGVGGDPR